MSASSAVKRTKSGLFVRNDKGLGLLAFSPFSGLLFAVPATAAKDVWRWLDGATLPSVEDTYGKSLGAGWHCDLERADFPIPHLLPSMADWSSLPQPRRPLLINWLITGRCPLACKYCYAEDLMRNESLEPTRHKVSAIASSIEEFCPLTVVLTGGDPLFSPHLRHAIEAISGRMGVIVDTSAYTLNEEHVAMFQEHRVAVRVSIDSERPKVHQGQRPPYREYPAFVKRGRTLEAALSGLCKCLDAGLAVTVQTVATKKTANDLVDLGDKLFRIGVRSWRVFKVAPSKARMKEYLSLVGVTTDAGRPYRGKAARGPYEYAFGRVLEARERHWGRQMAVQVTHNETANSVVLVSPDGRFVTESNTGSGKVLLDDQRPYRPRIGHVLVKVDMSGHASRYLNMGTRVSSKE